MTKNKVQSKTPILDDEDTGVHFSVVRQRWVQRQPDWQEGVQWDDCDEDVQSRYYKE